jgi:cystathionine beta-lyase/cystathionine gamma-synthase
VETPNAASTSHHPGAGSAASCAELRTDLQALAERVRALRARLRVHLRRLDAAAPDVPVSAARAVAPHVRELGAACDALASRLDRAAMRAGDDAAALERLRRVRREGAWRWRSLLGLAAAARTALDWQSPSFAHARRSQAGTLAGRVTGTKNDYKRDHHADADAYEAAWLDAYVDAPAGVRLQAYATASGMAALALAAVFVRGHIGDAPVLLGRSCWFQSRTLVRRLWGERQVIDVDERDVDAIAALAHERGAGAVFLDSLGNTEALPWVDLARLLPLLAQRVRRPLVVVLDNSLLASAGQAARGLPPHAPHLRLIVVESLNKYHQAGADRASAGMLWAAGEGLEGLFDTRMVLGVNIPDSHVHVLPPPDRAALDARLARIGRNARLLAERLQQAIAQAGGRLPFEGVVHPALAPHAAAERARALPFAGGTLNLIPRGPYRGSDAALRFIALAIEAARREGVELVGGAGFGFDDTRLYLTALFSSEHGRPFLRVAAGTECEVDAERTATVLVQAMHELARCAPAALLDDRSVALRLQRESLRRQPLGKWRDMAAWPVAPAPSPRAR